MVSPNFFNTFHFMVLHFPIALLILSFILDLIASIWRDSSWHDTLHKAGFITLLFGALTAIVTCLAGVVAWLALGIGPEIATHATKAIIVTVYAIILSLVRIYFVKAKKKDIGDNIFYIIFSFIAALLVVTQFKVYRYPHWAILQFTVPLIITGFLADIAAIIWKTKSWAKNLQDIGYTFLVLGTVSIIGAVITGYARAAELPHLVPKVKFSQAALQAHEVYGVITMIFFILLSAFRSFFHFKFEASNLLKGKAVFIVAAVIGIAVISYASHLGGTVALFPELFGK